MTLSIFQKQKFLIGYYTLGQTGWVIPGLLVAGGMLGGQAGIFMLLAAMSIRWIVFWLGHRMVNLPPAGAAAIAETIIQSQNAGLPIPKICQVATKGIGAHIIGPNPNSTTVILTPAFQEIPQEEQSAGIAHELAHARKRDPLSTALFITALAVFEIIAITVSLDRWFVGITLGALVSIPWLIELRAETVAGTHSGSPTALADLLDRMKKRDLTIKIWAYPCLSLFLVALALSPQSEAWGIISVAFMLGYLLPSHPPNSLRRWFLNRLAKNQGTPQ